MAEPERQNAKTAEWLRDFVAAFRSKYSTLTTYEREFVSDLDNFSAPCQLEMFWFRPPDAQYVIVTHIETRADLESTVHGPLGFYEALNKLDEQLANPQWDLPVEITPRRQGGPKVRKNLRNIIENLFVSMINDLKRLPFREPTREPIVGMKSLLEPIGFVWYVHGDIANQTPVQVATEIIQTAKTSAAKSHSPMEPRVGAPQETIKGHCAYIFPYAWIGELRRPTFRERTSGWFLPSTKIFEGKYKERVLVANRNGFLAIGEANRAKATRLLNEIMAVTLLDGEPKLAFKEQELGFAEINAQTKEIESYGSPGMSVRASLFEELWRPTVTTRLTRSTINLEEFQTWMARAEEICQDPDSSESLVFLLNAYTHLQNSSYLESLVLSWVVIEKHLYRVWETYLKTERFPRDRRDKLSDGFLVDSIIEVLNITGQLSLEEYQTLMSLKKIRNEIVHEGRDVVKEEAEKSMAAALKIVREMAQAKKTA